ncbi:MAG: isoleucine--tRNA ligase [Tenericutes bacterium]|nr:isoleucine--tRNA ligase [Mycoplasmatota bacterium]
MKFEKLEQGTTNEVETRYSQKWDEMDILEKTIENRKGHDDFVFYDGPATANGMPGIHHMLAKLLKDTVCKYKAMQGYRVLRKVGWDTHGLPVEVQVEKELGFSGKSDIEKYGIKEFNQKCRESVWSNEKSFSKFTREMGQFIDLKHPYVTYDNNYIETEWWILKKMFDEGYIYEGLKIVPWCPRCGTGLASHEVAQGYKEISVNTVFVPFKAKDQDNTYYLVWTTTPWTLLANSALCVNPEEDYVKCLSKGYNFILAEKLADKVLGEGYEVVERYKGRDLEGCEYEQLLPMLEVPKDKKAFVVTCADYVTMEDGTGVVHIAPAFGQDDYEVGLKYNLAMLNPVGEDGCYTEGPWKGRLVVDPELELEIVKYLAHEDKLFKKQKMNHDYPHCWRCKTPLVYYSKPSLYIKTTAKKDEIIEQNNKVCWHPEFVGEKRFSNWLENMVDWAISRDRYWGTPIPLWKCSCGHQEMIGSRKELCEKAVEDITEDIELHRPYVDDVHIKCPECGELMHRVKDVIDCWFDSGSMPFAQYHYPFENKELWESQYPADFICEGIDQTRGWFYSLLVVSVFVTGQTPYKNVLVNDLLLDKYGQKMHKSRGNAISPFEVMNKYGADTVRFYMLYASPVWTPLKFDEDGLKEIYSKYISTFKNAYSFFEMYANADNIDPREYNIPVKDRELIDRWLISKLNDLIEKVNEAYQEYDLNKAARAIVPFLNDDLSNWYIRSNRRRFWDSELTESKKAVYLTTYEVLVALCKLCAPMTPFITEEIFTKLTGKESVHLEDFPVENTDLVDSSVEERMDLVRDVCSLGRFAREEANIKVRQPISSLILPKSDEMIIGDLLPIITEELNVKKVEFKDDMSEYLEYIVKPNFKVLGKTLGPKIKLLQEALTKLSSNEVTKLTEKGSITIKLGDEDFELTNEMVLVSLKQKEGYASTSNNKTCVVLNTELTEDLILEGLAREFVRKVQSLRKDADFVITDHIKVYYKGTKAVHEMLDKYRDYVMGEVLGDELIEDESLTDECELNDEKACIKVERV